MVSEDKEKFWREVKINALIAFITSLICNLLILLYRYGIV